MFTYNFDPNTKLPNANLPVGGMPVYLQDLLNAQEYAYLNGLTAAARDYNVVLSGMEVDEVDVSAKTCKVLKGFFIIDSVIYQFSGYTGSYPFEIVPTGSTSVERFFASGDTNVIGSNYSTKYSVNVLTSGLNQYSGVPDKYIGNGVNVKAIFFDPFTCQRLNFLNNNHLSVRKGEKRLLNVSELTTTETGKSISNGSISMYYSDPSGLRKYKWIYSGWTSDPSYGAAYLRDNSSDEGGTDNIQLSKSNLPAHTHTSGSLVAVLDGIHYHEQQMLNETANTPQYDAMVSTSTFENSVKSNNPIPTSTDTGHTHGMSGITGDGGLSGSAFTHYPKFIGGFTLCTKDSLPYVFANNRDEVINQNGCWFL